MIITFPHLGNAYIAAKALFDGLGIQSIVPVPGNKEALYIGAKYSPDEICLPFKIMLGSYIEAINRGADTIIITGSCGPCRFGEYCELQMNILRKLGYDVNFIVVDNPFSIGKKEFINRISTIGKASSKPLKLQYKAAYEGYKIINLIDEIERKLRYLCGYEVNKGECKKMLKTCKEEAIEFSNPEDVISYLKSYRERIKNIKVDYNKNPIKIAIIGEIYTILEPFANLYIEYRLMDYGVSTKKSLTPSWWVKNLLLTPLKLNSINIRKASKEYLPFYIGGHARECIGEAMLAKKEGFNGAIQIFPVGCMPEIVSKSILPTIAKNEDFPIMTLVVDEMTGEGGYITRVEAFLDLLERRRKNVLYGS